MINVATVGVDIHRANIAKPGGISRILINNAAPTAMHSTRTEKMAALFVSASFVNITQFPSPAASSARCVGGECVIALAFLASDETLGRRGRQHTVRTTCLGYWVFERKGVAAPGRVA